MTRRLSVGDAGREEDAECGGKKKKVKNGAWGTIWKEVGGREGKRRKQNFLVSHEGGGEGYSQLVLRLPLSLGRGWQGFTRKYSGVADKMTG